ncbi:MAG: hypothetical protein EP315_01765 [Gammaproteobacteria bacterium]|nr:MAG: hypothetical protein EP315_01765 [Gammaproteobacteria bacterium]
MKYQNHVFLTQHDNLLVSFKKLLSRRMPARWVIVTRNEYLRLQIMQGLLVLLVVGLTGVVVK